VPRTFQNIKALRDASFFLHDKRQTTDPDHGEAHVKPVLAVTHP
jgi:hypothetical protein